MHSMKLPVQLVVRSLLVLVVLPSLRRQAVVLGRRWSGAVLQGLLVVVDVGLDVMLLVVLVCVGRRTCSRPGRRCAWGGPGLSRQRSRDTSNG